MDLSDEAPSSDSSSESKELSEAELELIRFLTQEISLAQKSESEVTPHYKRFQKNRQIWVNTEWANEANPVREFIRLIRCKRPRSNNFSPHS